MNLLERWECPEHGELTGNWWTTSDDVRRCGHPDCAASLRLEKVVYVPASQLQGAVEQRDLLLTAVREAMVSLNSGEVPTGHVAAYLRRMSSIVSGGQ